MDFEMPYNDKISIYWHIAFMSVLSFVIYFFWLNSDLLAYMLFSLFLALSWALYFFILYLSKGITYFVKYKLISFFAVMMLMTAAAYFFRNAIFEERELENLTMIKFLKGASYFYFMGIMPFVSELLASVFKEIRFRLSAKIQPKE